MSFYIYRASLHKIRVLLFAVAAAVSFPGCSHLNENSDGKDSVSFVSGRVRGISADAGSYDKEFIAGLGSYRGSILLKERTLIAEKDTISFPLHLEGHKEYTFTGTSGAQRFRLSIKRTNYTNLIFRFTSSLNGKQEYLRTGKAVLDPFFFNGTNAFDDLENGEIFPAHEYRWKGEEGTLSIHSGIIPDEHGRLRAVVTFRDREDDKKHGRSPVLKTSLSVLSKRL